jgi:putative transposase
MITFETTLGDRDKNHTLYRKHRRSRQNKRKAAARLRAKLKNKVNDCQHKLANYLCSHYRVVLLPEFRTSDMCKRTAQGKRRLHRTTSRGMYGWAHHRFRERLKAKATQFASCSVIICDERYTSQPCGVCGHLDKQSSKTHKCSECNTTLDRDVNGARNILLRYLQKKGCLL